MVYLLLRHLSFVMVLGICINVHQSLNHHVSSSQAARVRISSFVAPALGEILVVLGMLWWFWVLTGVWEEGAKEGWRLGL